MGKSKDTQFSLPNDLGWECNDEISKYMDGWIKKAAQYVTNPDGSLDLAAWAVAKAECMDSVYAIIKKYQDKK